MYVTPVTISYISQFMEIMQTYTIWLTKNKEIIAYNKLSSMQENVWNHRLYYIFEQCVGKLRTPNIEQLTCYSLAKILGERFRLLFCFH